MLAGSVLHPREEEVVTEDVNELELHFEERSPITKRWVHGHVSAATPQQALSMITAWSDGAPSGYKYRHFRLYEYTSEHGLREISLPEVKS